MEIYQTTDGSTSQLTLESTGITLQAIEGLQMEIWYRTDMENDTLIAQEVQTEMYRGITLSEGTCVASMEIVIHQDTGYEDALLFRNQRISS